MLIASYKNSVKCSSLEIFAAFVSNVQEKVYYNLGEIIKCRDVLLITLEGKTTYFTILHQFVFDKKNLKLLIS